MKTPRTIIHKTGLTLMLIAITQASTAQTQNVTVLEYHPAPGQFVNTMPEATNETTQEEILARCTEALREGSLVHLGAFGGYITVEFDHPIQNLRGSDIRIRGNATYAVNNDKAIGGSIEPGIVYVGVGDSPETAAWYELAGSEYYTSEIHDFKITYHKPTAETGAHQRPNSIYDNYIKWEATWTADGVRRDSSGYNMKNTFHQQSYWPQWQGENNETLTFSGGKLPNNAIDQSGNGSYWVLYRYTTDSYGYVDASLSNEDASTFDIDWAVDNNGNHISLNQINYIRITSSLLQECGWIGETSTEVSGIEDLHLIAGYDDNPIIITPRTPTAAGSTKLHATHRDTQEVYYDLTGRKILHPQQGIYINHGKKIIVK